MVLLLFYSSGAVVYRKPTIGWNTIYTIYFTLSQVALIKGSMLVEQTQYLYIHTITCENLRLLLRVVYRTLSVHPHFLWWR
jgi:hypothetical protein